MKPFIPDNIDLQLLRLLEENAKLNNKELAAAVGLTVTPTFERIRRLEQAGIIRGYRAEIDTKKLGKELRVICQVSLSSHAFEGITRFESAIRDLPQIIHAWHVTGSMDYMLTVEVADMYEYQDFLKNGLSRIPHVGQVNSSFVLSELK